MGQQVWFLTLIRGLRRAFGAAGIVFDPYKGIEKGIWGSRFCFWSL